MNEAGEIVNKATYGGIAGKGILLVVMTFLSAVASFIGSVLLIDSDNIGLLAGLLIGSIIVAAICGFVGVLIPSATKIAGPLYAVAEGLVVGFISLFCWAFGFGGEVFAALFSTIGVFLVMLFLYAKGIVKVGKGFKTFMLSALIAIIVVNLLMFLLSLTSPMLNEIFYGNGLFSIAISVIMVVFASLISLFDLNRMPEIVEGGLDKKFEWVAAFGLLITLVWLYLEFLKLFIKLANRRR
jgi:uncharacterized YccA/Bax inhibitor family protein